MIEKYRSLCQTVAPCSIGCDEAINCRADGVASPAAFPIDLGGPQKHIPGRWIRDQRNREQRLAHPRVRPAVQPLKHLLENWPAGDEFPE